MDLVKYVIPQIFSESGRGFGAGTLPPQPARVAPHPFSSPRPGGPARGATRRSRPGARGAGFVALEQTIVEVMKIMVNSFKRSHACTATLSAPNPAAGPRQPTPPLETPGHSLASLGQSLVGSLLLSPGSWCTQGSVCALQESILQSCVNSGSSMVGLMVTSSKTAYAKPKSAAPRALVPVAVHC